MNSNTLFHVGCIADSLSVVSKKQLLQEMAELAVECGIGGDKQVRVREIVNAVSERERLGSTGVGSGVAIPHARIDGIDSVRAVFARLETPLDYESIDERPVDLVVMLLAPKGAGGDHLKALAKVSRLLRREEMRDRLRNAPDVGALHLLLTEGHTANAA